MNNLYFKIGLVYILFLLIIISGIFLAKIGRSLNTKIFALHKIISILTIVASSIFISQFYKSFGTSPIVLIFIVLSILFTLLEIITGAILSFEKPNNLIILYLHKYIPVIILIFTSLTVYFLVFKK